MPSRADMMAEVYLVPPSVSLGLPQGMERSSVMEGRWVSDEHDITEEELPNAELEVLH